MDTAILQYQGKLNLGYFIKTPYFYFLIYRKTFKKNFLFAISYIFIIIIFSWIWSGAYDQIIAKKDIEFNIFLLEATLPCILMTFLKFDPFTPWFEYKKKIGKREVQYSIYNTHISYTHLDTQLLILVGDLEKVVLTKDYIHFLPNSHRLISFPMPSQMTPSQVIEKLKETTYEKLMIKS